MLASESRIPSRVAARAALLAIVLILIGIPAATSAAPSEWSRVSTPTDDDLVILPGSDIIDYAVAGCAGDTLYAIGLWYDECLTSGYQHWSDGENVQNDQLVPRLWKSSDAGMSWKDCTSEVQDADGIPSGEEFVFFSAIAAAPDDSEFVIVAGYDDDYEVMIAGSTDGADEFSIAGCGDIEGEVLCMAVSPEIDGVRHLAAGTKDLTSGGRVWRLDVGSYWQGYWQDTSSYDGWLDSPFWTSETDVFAITSLEFSPNFDYDETLVGMAIGVAFSPDLAPADEFGYGPGGYPAYHLFAGNWDGVDAWNTEAGFEYYPGIFATSEALLFASTYYTGSWDRFFESPFLRMATDIALPYDYSGEDPTDRTCLISVNGSLVPAAFGMPADEGGYLFLMIDMAPAFELLNQDDNPFVSSVDYRGSVTLMGDVMVGLAFPETWDSSDIRGWYDDGDPSLPCCEGLTVLYTDTPIGRNPCCPDNWGRADKNPTGQFNARVAFNVDGSVAYASTQGCSFMADSGTGYWSDESAFSISYDRGVCWNQPALIDTDIDYIADTVVNGACGEIYVATVNGPDTYECCDCDSVWRSNDDGDTYLRIWCDRLRGDYNQGTEWAVMDVPPEQTDEVSTLYMADLGTRTIYYATYGGLCGWDSRSTGLDYIVDISVLEDTTVYVLDRDGSVVKSTNHARRWTSPEDSKVTDDSGEEARSIEAYGDYVLVGGDMGDVTYSSDAGESYSALDDIGDGKVRLAFDSYFDENDYIYAAVAEGGADNGVYRTTIADADFESILDCDCATNFWDLEVSNPDGNPYTDASTGGVLYVAYVQSCDAECPISGVARCLDPASAQCCGDLSWDYLFTNLLPSPLFSVEPDVLDICGCVTEDGDTTIYAIDGRAYYNGWDGCHAEFNDPEWGRLWQHTDCFSKAAPEPIGVHDGTTIASDPCECVNEEFILEWDRLCDACEYEIEIALDKGFTHVIWETNSICANWPSASCDTYVDCYDNLRDTCESDIRLIDPSDPCSPSILVPQGTLDCNQTYWWRVRANLGEPGEIYRSQWSKAMSFTIAVGPKGAVKLTAPANGTTRVSLHDVIFTWTAVADARAYEFTLLDSSGVEIASYSGDETSYVLTSSLDYDAAYVWQVKAMMGSNVLSESAISTFRTVMKPTPTAEIPEVVINFPEPPGTPSWVWVVIGMAAALIVVVVVLVFRTKKL